MQRRERKQTLWAVVFSLLGLVSAATALAACILLWIQTGPGMATRLLSVALILCVAGVLLLVAYRAASKRLLSPLAALARGAVAASTAGVPLAPLAYPGGITEIDALTDAFNTLLAQLEGRHHTVDLLDRILNGMDAFIYLSDPETGQVLYVNDKLRERFSLDGDPLGKPYWTLLPDDRETVQWAVQALLADPARTITREVHDREGGRYYGVRDSLIDRADGRKAHLHHRVDITTTKETELALTRRMQQQQIMADITRGFILNRDSDALIATTLEKTGKFIGAGRTLIARTQSKDGETALAYEWYDARVAPQPIGDRFVPFAPGNPIYDALAVHGEPYILINDTAQHPALSHIQGDGVGALLAMPLHINGTLWGIMSVSIFHHAHHWSESDLQLLHTTASILSAVVERDASEKALMRMSSIAQGSPYYVSYIDTEGRFLYLNEGAVAITGYSKEELTEGGMALMYDEKTLTYIQRELLPAVLREGTLAFELTLTRKGGERRIVSFSTFTIGTPPEGIGAIALDVTEQRQTEKELLVAKEEAERSNLAKSEFLSRMSHEMRTPMNAIIGMTNMGKGTCDIEKKDYCLERIDEASTHLLGVINDILDMSKIEANKFELSPSEFDFERMVSKVCDIAHFRINEKDQNLLVHIDQSIPETVIADEQRLAQVITNLLSNATKFTPERGTIRLNIDKESESGDEITLRFDVTDTGVGLSPEQQSRLFHAFEQGDGSISRRYGGTGLGLVISRRIVRLMGGDIRVKSQEGQGASFIFTIKVLRGTPRQARQKAGVDLSTLRVLIVDDAPEVREYFLHLAQQLGFQCDAAADGFDALRMVEQSALPYDVAFLDWKMPGMDGVTLAKRLKAMPNAPAAVIMISSADWTDIEASASEAGIRRFMPKPLFASNLVDCLNGLFGDPALSLPKDPKPAEPPVDQYKGMRILLAEDIQINREIVAALLEPTGVCIDSAENGVQAVDMFAANPSAYDLIFMDIHMPEMDGYEATRRIRAMDCPQAKSVPIVAMTANVFREDIERCLAAGMNDHIGKPIDIEEFYTKLRRYMRKGGSVHARG